MSGLPNPFRAELVAIGAFVKAQTREAQTAVIGRWHTRTAVPELVAAADAAAALANSRVLLAEILGDMDPGGNQIRANVASLHEMAEQGKSYTHFQPIWLARQLAAVSAQPKLAPRRARTS
jgi:hypothetical protein